ncbi:MAG: S8 family serine peptidase [candidate division Zixibacteria bacterium]|nr:S8 family serine peptidase [candidate division Zixibacteria bacterium]
MKTIKTTGMIFLLLAAFSVTLKAESDYFYYYLDNHQVSADYNDTLIAARMDTLNNLHAAWLAQVYDFLTLDYDFKPIGGRFHTYRIEPGYDLETVMDTLRQNEEVFMVNPIIMKRDTIPLYLNNRIVALFEDGMLYEDVETLVSAYGLTIGHVIGTEEPYYYVLEFLGSTDQNIIEIANTLTENSPCRLAHPDFLCNYDNLLAEPQDPYFAEQWHLHNIGQGGGTPDADIDFPEALEWNFDTAWQIRIAIIDMGFEMDHEDLPENYLWAPINVAGSNIWSDNYEDTIPTDDPINTCPDDAPRCWHGTMELGLIAPIIDNSIGLSGLSNNIKIKPIRFCDDNGVWSPTTILKALKAAHRFPLNADVVCCPFFCVDSAGTIANELEFMYEHSTPVFFSAGNSGSVEFPANLPSVCAVGMTDRNDNVPSWSGHGSELDIVAPGLDIWSFDLSGTAGINDGSQCNGDPDYFCHYGGTSVAAALVSGVAARVLCYRTDLIDKGMSAQPLFDLLYNSANDIGTKGRDNAYGHGRLNALRAFLIAKAGDANDDCAVNVSDAVWLINYVFVGGPEPQPYFALGDANGDCAVNVSDAVWIINYVFIDGAPPRYCPSIMPE